MLSFRSGREILEMDTLKFIHNDQLAMLII
jgi:hypothetical protein